MTTVGIHQPQYLPWLGLIDRASRCDVFVVLDSVPYSKNYFYNRNKIKTANGPIWLTVPVLTKGQMGQPFTDTKIDIRQDWRSKHWKSIVLSYRNASCFSEYQGFLEECLKREWPVLADLCLDTFQKLLTLFGIHTPVVRSSSMPLQGSKEELLLNICREVGASRYLSGPDGRNYLTPERWKEANIAVDFQSYVHPAYPQLYGEFVPNLSCIDLLFNCGDRSLTLLRKDQPKYFCKPI